MEHRVYSCTNGRIAAWHVDGDPLYVYLHGLACGKDHFLNAFKARPFGRGMLAVDLPGFGESDRFAEGVRYTFSNHANSVSEAIKQALREGSAKSISLVLHSMASGLIPRLLQSSLPITSIVLIEGNIIPNDSDWSQKIASFPEAKLKRYFSSLQIGGRHAIATQLKGQYARKELDELARCYTQADERAFRETAIATVTSTNEGHAIAALRNFAGIKVYLRGKLSSEWAGWPIVGEAGIKTATIEDAGHFPHLDNPEKTYEFIFSLTSAQE